MSAPIPVTIGFIPLVDAAALLVAVDKGFIAREGLRPLLVREVSWANMRDKLAVGLFDAAHLLAPMAVASNLGLAQVKVPLVAPVNLAMNGNAIAVSTALHAALREFEGAICDPAASARALVQIAARRKAAGQEPLTFGMTFPFSTHNYQLRYWLAEGGVDPDEDMRIVALPPSYMVENLARGQLDGFCVGAPWSSMAVEAGVGAILHFGCEIFARAPEKVLALRESSVAEDPGLAAALTRAVVRGAAYADDEANRDEVAELLARPEYVGVDAKIIRRVLEGRLRRGAEAEASPEDRYLILGKDGATRPEPAQAAWIYAQMLRWGQTRFSLAALRTAKGVMRSDLYDAATGIAPRSRASEAIGAFAGPSFDADEIGAYLAGFAIGKKL
jgi:NitT/TauT family transport system ATP-binding protein